MFPSVSNQSQFAKEKPKVNLDWLVNASFKVDVNQSVDFFKKVEEKASLEKDQNKESVKKLKKKRKHHSQKLEKPKLHHFVDENEKRKKIASFSNKIFLEETGLLPEEAFRIDNKPDQNNLAFNSAYYALVPSYDKNKCIKTRNILNHAKKALKPVRYSQAKNLIKKSNEESELIIPILKHEMKAFIPLKINKFSNLSQNLDSSRLSNIYDSSTQLYIHGKGLEKEINSKPLNIQFTSMPSNSNQPFKPTFDQIIYSKTQNLNKYLKENPNDIEKWFQFLKFQEENLTFEEDQSTKKPSEIIIAEKKLSIVEKALKANPKCIRLIVEKLKILEMLSSSEQVESEWEKMVFLYPNVPFIWNEYFIFLQTNLTHFTCSKLLKAFTKCLKTFNLMLEGLFDTHKSPENLEVEILKVVYQMCLFLEESGYIEKSIAIFQALIEFNFYSPKKLNFEMSLEDWIVFFEPFWESGSPRFGEMESLGWSQVMDKKCLPTNFQTLNIDSMEDEILKNEKDKTQIWLKIEKLKEQFYWLPVKSFEFEEVDDPERSIMIDDIVPFLFRFRKKETKFELIVYFLKFLNIIEDSSLPATLFKFKEIETFKFKNYFQLPSTINLNDLFSFQDRVLVKSIEALEQPYKKKLTEYRICFLIECVKKKIISFKQARKAIKEILKLEENRNDIDLWTLYTDLEALKENKKDAQQVYQTAISLFIGNIDLKRLLSFVCKFCQFMLEIKPLSQMTIEFKGKQATQNDNHLLSTLIGVVNKSNNVDISSVFVLKTLRILDLMIEETDEYKNIIVYCKALIYLFNQDINKIWVIYEEQLSNNTNYLSQKLFTSYLEFIIINCNRSFGSLSLLRKVLKRALNDFPTNQEYLSLFIQVESKMFYSTSIQRFFQMALKKVGSDHLILWLYYIYSEIRRLETLKDNWNGLSCDAIVNKVRSIFQACLKSSSNCKSTLIWRLFINFEKNYGLEKKARPLIYQSIKHCPWSKNIYLDSISYFPNMISEMVDIINEKEIRLRTPLQEIELLLKTL